MKSTFDAAWIRREDNRQFCPQMRPLNEHQWERYGQSKWIDGVIVEEVVMILCSLCGRDPLEALDYQMVTR